MGITKYLSAIFTYWHNAVVSSDLVAALISKETQSAVCTKQALPVSNQKDGFPDTWH